MRPTIIEEGYFLPPFLKADRGEFKNYHPNRPKIVIKTDKLRHDLLRAAWVRCCGSNYILLKYHQKIYKMMQTENLAQILLYAGYMRLS